MCYLFPGYGPVTHQSYRIHSAHHNTSPHWIFFYCRNCWKYRICVWTSDWRHHDLLWGRYKVSKGGSGGSRHRCGEMGARLSPQAVFLTFTWSERTQVVPSYHGLTYSEQILVLGELGAFIHSFTGHFSIPWGVLSACLLTRKKKIKTSLAN